jgi:hypothetical protein
VLPPPTPGFHPAKVLPCVIDVGTNNAALRADPLYCGLDQPRITGLAYYELIDEVGWEPWMTLLSTCWYASSKVQLCLSYGSTAVGCLEPHSHACAGTLAAQLNPATVTGREETWLLLLPALPAVCECCDGALAERSVAV